MSDNESDKVKHMVFNRIDILCGFPVRYPQFPCEICGKLECLDTSELCKDNGAHGLGISFL
jgi:hypothetical protein